MDSTKIGGPGILCQVRHQPDEKPNLYAVFGDPILHSKSPLIHTLFAAQMQQPITYSAIHTTQNNLATALDRFEAQGGQGANITLPFKQSAVTLVDSISEQARLAQAINTIQFNKNGRRFGDNTDGVGLVRDLIINHRMAITGKRILILGAGGAVRGILGPLLAEQPASITLVNRTPSKAWALAAQFAKLGAIRAGDITNLNAIFDLIINGTSASLYGKIPFLPGSLIKNAFCYDMAYASTATPFMQWAAEQGANICCDGLGMLIEQAAESFYLWHGIRPDTAKVKHVLSQNAI